MNSVIKDNILLSVFIDTFILTMFEISKIIEFANDSHKNTNVERKLWSVIYNRFIEEFLYEHEIIII